MSESKDLRKRAADLHQQANRLNDEAEQLEQQDRADKLKANETITVDRNNQLLMSGQAVPEDRSHVELMPSGMQKDYVVLSADERAKGFVRPYRDSYRHGACGKVTTMSRPIAETYARDPYFYSGTFCSTCRSHYPVGDDGEFTWYENDGSEGPMVGT